jgi:hypothetical protein
MDTILVAHYEILILAELIAFDEAPALQLFTGFGILGDHPDTVAGIGIDQVEPDRGPIMPRIVKRHGARNECEAKVTPPDGTCGHQAARRDCQAACFSSASKSASALSSCAAFPSQTS